MKTNLTKTGQSILAKKQDRKRKDNDRKKRARMKRTAGRKQP